MVFIKKIEDQASVSLHDTYWDARTGFKGKRRQKMPEKRPL
jgi:hypothetical protein